MGSYYQSYGGGAYRRSYSGGSYRDAYQGYTYRNPASGAYRHYDYASSGDATRSDFTSQGGDSYQHAYTYENAATGYYHSEHFTAQLYGDGRIYQHYQGVQDIPTYLHEEYVSQTVTGSQAGGYRVSIPGAEVSSYFYNNVTAGYVRGSSTAYGYSSGYGEYISGSRVTELLGDAPSTFTYSGYRPFGYVPS